MNLIDRQKQQLRDTIQTRLTEDHLKSIFLENEEKFGQNFYNQISGESYRDRVTRIVRELDNRSLIECFIAVVRQECSNFAQTLVENCSKIQCYLKSYEKLSELISILQKTFSTTEVKRILKFDTFEELEKYLLNLIRCDCELLSFIESSEDWTLSGFCPTLKDFIKESVGDILTNKNLNFELKKQLKHWINDNYPELDCSAKDRANSMLQSYLLISIYPRVGKTKATKKKTFNIQAEFIEDFPQKLNQPVDLNPEDIKEEGCLEKEIPDFIYKIIQKAENDYLSPKVSQNQTYNLRIELFLTTNLLTKRFEFKIPQVWKKEQIAICERYSVTLRSLNRLVKTDWQNACLKKWQQIPSLQPEHICDFDNDGNLQNLLSNSMSKKQLRLKLEKSVIVKVFCCLTPHRTEDFFEILLEKGVPLCFWLNNPENSNINILSNLTRMESFKNLESLYDEIFELRRIDLAQANKKGLLGYNLGILCDNTNRNLVNIPKFNQLAS